MGYYRAIVAFLAIIVALILLYFRGVGVNIGGIFTIFNYKVIYVIDENNYTPTIGAMELYRLRDKSPPISLRITGSGGRPIQLYRHKVGEIGYSPIDTNEIPISWPVVLKNSDIPFTITLYCGSEQIKNVLVDNNNLKPFKDELRGFIIPISMAKVAVTAY